MPEWLKKMVGEWSEHVGGDARLFERFAEEVERETRHRAERTAQAMCHAIHGDMDLSWRDLETIEQSRSKKGES